MRPIHAIALTSLLGLPGGAASAQGIALFGDARLGLGYNIENDGSVRVDDDGSPPDDLRAVSRVRFGVVMTGESDSGIVFGASVRADNAAGGEGDTDGQTAGTVFVSGAWGSLTFGDTNGADEEWVGDVPGNYSLTGLSDINETRFISNGGSFGGEEDSSFAENPNALPTVRYDYSFGNFGFSISTDRNLGDIGVGAGYSGNFGDAGWSIGAGYYKFDSFIAEGGETFVIVDDVLVEGRPAETFVPDGEQWSVGLNVSYDPVEFGITYMKLNSDGDVDGQVDADNLLVGGSYSFDAWSVGAFWGNVLSANGAGDFDALDGDDGYGLTAQYDLGGGATINGGIANSYDTSPGNDETIADFGISMSF